MDDSKRKTLIQRRTVGKLAREIYKLYIEGNEEEAYDKLGTLNGVLSDANGSVVEMEYVIDVMDRTIGKNMLQ